MKGSIGCEHQKKIIAKLGKNGDVSEGFMGSLMESKYWKMTGTRLESWRVGVTQGKFILLFTDLWAPLPLFSLIADHLLLLCRQGPFLSSGYWSSVSV